MQLAERSIDCMRRVLVITKPTEKRICTDPKPLNEVLRRSHFLLPTIDDILPLLVQSNSFFQSVMFHWMKNLAF